MCRLTLAGVPIRLIRAYLRSTPYNVQYNVGLHRQGRRKSASLDDARASDSEEDPNMDACTVRVL
jgi:hypothetical protein